MSCECCTPNCEPFTVSYSTAGYVATRGNISESIWNTVPAVYKSMKWLTIVELENLTSERVTEYLCNPGVSEFYRVVSGSNEDCQVLFVYPDISATIASGTETRNDDSLTDGCADPPDTAIDTFDHRTGDWIISASGYIWSYTRTTHRSPPTTTGNLQPSIQYNYVNTIPKTLELADGHFYENSSGSYDETTSTTHLTGSGSWRRGYRDLADITVTLEAPASAIFLHVKYTLLFMHYDTAAETVIESGEWIFLKGDNDKEITFTPPHPGTVKLTTHYRCSRNMPFTSLTAEQ